MIKALSVFVLVSSSALLFGCSNNQTERQMVYKAPLNEAEISSSFITMNVSALEKEEILDNNPQGLARKLADSMYEFRGVTKQSILEAAPNATVEKNHFSKPQASNHEALFTKEQILNDIQKFDAAREFSPSNCSTDSLLRVPNFTFSSDNNFSKAQVGAAITFEVITTSSTGLTAWYVMPPFGSHINIQYDSNKSFSLTPDMPGTYRIALLHKKNGLCNVRLSQLSVTLDEPYEAESSEKDAQALSSLSNFDFLQVGSTKADLAQEALTSKNKVVVAVIDTGVNYNHPALKNKMWVNDNEVPGDGVDNDGNGFVDDVVGYDFENDDFMPMDDAGHGSHVAGLAAGEFMGSGGENIKIMALKAGSANGFDLGSLIKCMMYAIENGAKVINLSLGNPHKSSVMNSVISKAMDEGILVVAAVGNGDQRGIGMNNDLIPQYPASYDLPNILSVGASKPDGSLTSYSNYGQKEVDIVAIGGHASNFEPSAHLLRSAYIKNPSNILLQPSAGTSMAAPLVAGIAAMVFAEDNTLSPADVRKTLMETGQKSPFLEGVVLSESVVDAHAAIQSLQMLF